MTNTLYRHPTSLRLSDADIPHRQRPRSANRSRQRRRSPPKRRATQHGTTVPILSGIINATLGIPAQSPLLFQITKSH